MHLINFLRLIVISLICSINKLKVPFLQGGRVDINVDELISEVTRPIDNDKWLKFLNESPVKQEKSSCGKQQEVYRPRHNDSSPSITCPGRGGGRERPILSCPRCEGYPHPVLEGVPHPVMTGTPSPGDQWKYYGMEMG